MLNSLRRLSLPPGEGVPSHKGWRLGLLLALPVPALALLIGLALEHPSGQATPFDLIVYPLVAALLVGLDLLLLFRIWSFERVFRVTMASACAFFLSKLVYILYFLPPSADFFRELSETFPWVPSIYVLSSLLPLVRGGRAIAFTCLSCMVLISTLYAVPNLAAGENYGTVYALSQLVLANVTFYVLTQLFSIYMERFIRSQTHALTMERLAYTDLLTGLPNRLALENELKRLLFEGDPPPLGRGGAPRETLAVLFIDIDGFKLINDTMGHEAGDTLLVMISQRLRACGRQGDLLARISGDEYVFVLRNVRQGDEAVRVAEKLKLALDEPFFVEGQVLSVSASIGVSVYPEDALDPAALLRHADSAMYHVKNSGKNGVKRYHASVDAALEEHKRLERDLRGALGRGELHLYYQPLFHLESGKLLKAEALLRWHHPTRGWISPAEFVPLAESNGFILSLGEWVLQTAMTQARRWQQGSTPVHLSINVSPLQFAQPGFKQTVLEALAASRLGPHLLELELTESIVMRNPEIVRRNLQELQAEGITIAIDDFGTGYSSLSYLRDFDINTIKIDRSFIRDLSTPRHAPQYALALIEAIVKLAGSLDVELVAEGIESREQFELVRSLGCDVGQGYFFARPMSALEFSLLLEHEPHRPVTFGQVREVLN